MGESERIKAEIHLSTFWSSKNKHIIVVDKAIRYYPEEVTQRLKTITCIIIHMSFAIVFHFSTLGHFSILLSEKRHTCSPGADRKNLRVMLFLIITLYCFPLLHYTAEECVVRAESFRPPTSKAATAVFSNFENKFKQHHNNTNAIEQ